LAIQLHLDIAGMANIKMHAGPGHASIQQTRLGRPYLLNLGSNYPFSLFKGLNGLFDGRGHGGLSCV